MPPYKRLIAASSAACINDLNSRGGKPKSISVESIKLKLSPYKSVRAMAAAEEITLCPLGYSGNGGVVRIGSHLSSRCWLITVSGLTSLLRYFSSQQLINPSARARDTIA